MGDRIEDHKVNKAGTLMTWIQYDISDPQVCVSVHFRGHTFTLGLQKALRHAVSRSWLPWGVGWSPLPKLWVVSPFLGPAPPNQYFWIRFASIVTSWKFVPYFSCLQPHGLAHYTAFYQMHTLNKSRLFPGLVEARMPFFKFSNHSCFQPNFISTHVSNPRLVRVTMMKTVGIQEALLSLPAPQSLPSLFAFPIFNIRFYQRWANGRGKPGLLVMRRRVKLAYARVALQIAFVCSPSLKRCS